MNSFTFNTSCIPYFICFCLVENHKVNSSAENMLRDKVFSCLYVFICHQPARGQQRRSAVLVVLFYLSVLMCCVFFFKFVDQGQFSLYG